MIPVTKFDNIDLFYQSLLLTKTLTPDKTYVVSSIGDILLLNNGQVEWFFISNEIYNVIKEIGEELRFTTDGDLKFSIDNLQIYLRNNKLNKI